jgi:hypothetical protein
MREYQGGYAVERSRVRQMSEEGNTDHLFQGGRVVHTSEYDCT